MSIRRQPVLSHAGRPSAPPPMQTVKTGDTATAIDRLCTALRVGINLDKSSVSGFVKAPMPNFSSLSILDSPSPSSIEVLFKPKVPFSFDQVKRVEGIGMTPTRWNLYTVENVIASQLLRISIQVEQTGFSKVMAAEYLANQVVAMNERGKASYGGTKVRGELVFILDLVIATFQELENMNVIRDATDEKKNDIFSEKWISIVVSVDNEMVKRIKSIYMDFEFDKTDAQDIKELIDTVDFYNQVRSLLIAPYVLSIPNYSMNLDVYFKKDGVLQRKLEELGIVPFARA